MRRVRSLARAARVVDAGRAKREAPDTRAKRGSDVHPDLPAHARLVAGIRSRVAVVTFAMAPRMLPLEPSDELALRSAVLRLGLSEEAAIRAALPLFHARVLGRGEYLLRAGERAELAGVLVNGLLREHFVTERGVERTKSFVTALQFTGSLADLLSGEPARPFIVAEESSRVVLAPYAELRRLEQLWPSWAAAARRSLEHLLLSKAEREYQFMCLDAEHRYAAFLARHPDLEARVAATHIASYLAMTPVHLSRLRARRARARPPGRV